MSDETEDREQAPIWYPITLTCKMPLATFRVDGVAEYAPSESLNIATFVMVIVQ